MKYIKSLLVPITVIFFFFSCNDGVVETRTTPTPTDETVSGTAFYDTDGDGSGDEAMYNAIVHLGDSLLLTDPLYSDSTNTNQSVLKTLVDINGNYIFEGVQPKENQLIRIYPFGIVTDLVGIDNTPDGDLNETLNNQFIQIAIDVNENDDGNDFIAFKSPSTYITGSVLIDDNMDLIGDLPAVNHRMELYERGGDGLPITQTGWPLFAAYTDGNGYYEFKDVLNGEYVIYHIGTGDYEYVCVSHMDETPETNEPPVTDQCQFIPVNINDMVIEDHDNVYVITKSTESGKLSGLIYQDITEDGNVDELTDLIITVNVFERDDNGFPTGPVLYTTESTEEGSFSFENLEPGNYVLTIVEPVGLFETMNSGGGNIGDGALPNLVSFDIVLGTELTDLYFLITIVSIDASISGVVYEDLDNDGVGDEIIFDHTIELYYRGSDNLPMGDMIYKTDMTGQGRFVFSSLNTGNYVLVLTGPSNFSCSSSGDQSPESGEPTNSPDCKYILVNFEEGVEDEDNNYVVQQ